MTFGQKATRSPSFANPNGVVHEVDVLHPTNWLDAVTMLVEGVGSSWVNAVLQDVATGHKPLFRTWVQFEEALV